MATQYTPVYQFPYPQDGDPVKNGPAIMKAQSERFEQALKDGNFPASTPDIASLTARLNIAEKPPLVTVGLVTNDIGLVVNVGEYPIVWNQRAGDTTMNPDANRDRLVAPISGWYQINATVVFSNTAGGQREMGFQTYKGANQATKTFYRGQNNTAPSTSFFIETSGSLTVYLLAGEYVRVTIEIAQQASTTHIKADQGTRASMLYLRPA